MPKLVYVYGDDSRMLDTLLSSLRSNGYSVEYTSVSNEMGKNRIMADIALICTPVNPTHKVQIGELTIDTENMEVMHHGKVLHFTPTEFSMLSYLLKNSSRAVPRTELLPAVWGNACAKSCRGPACPLKPSGAMALKSAGKSPSPSCGPHAELPAWQGRLTMEPAKRIIRRKFERRAPQAIVPAASLALSAEEKPAGGCVSPLTPEEWDGRGGPCGRPRIPPGIFWIFLFLCPLTPAFSLRLCERAEQLGAATI